MWYYLIFKGLDLRNFKNFGKFQTPLNKKGTLIGKKEL
jgi:hypothetical protein